SRSLEVSSGWIEHREIKIRSQEFQHAIRLQNDIGCAGNLSAKRGHRFCKTPHLGAYPKYMRGTRRQKARSVGFSRTVLLLGNCPGVIVGSAVTQFTVRGAYSVAVLCDLHCCPLQFGQCSNQASDHTGLAHAAGMSTYNYDCHSWLSSVVASR